MEPEYDGPVPLVTSATSKARKTWKAKKSSSCSLCISTPTPAQSKDNDRARQQFKDMVEDEEVVIVVDDDEEKELGQDVAWNMYSRSALLLARQHIAAAEARGQCAEDRLGTASTCSTDEPRDDFPESSEQSVLASKLPFALGKEVLDDMLARRTRASPAKRVMSAAASEFRPASNANTKRFLNAAAAEFVPMTSACMKVSPLNADAPIFKPISKPPTRSHPHFEPSRPMPSTLKIRKPPTYAAQAAAAALRTLTKEPPPEPAEQPEIIKPKPSGSSSRCVFLAVAVLCAAGASVANAARRRSL